MSYLREFIYQILPQEPYTILRNCSSCGIKSVYKSTFNFRINSNGKRMDIWLIYQCNKCKHTYNLTVFKRISESSISQQEYRDFMGNDRKLAMKYGTDKMLFVKNKADFVWSSTEYLIIEQNPQSVVSDEKPHFQSGDVIIIENPFGLKIRTDKIASKILQITRGAEKKLEDSGKVMIQVNNQEQTIQIWIREI